MRERREEQHAGIADGADPRHHRRSMAGAIRIEGLAHRYGAVEAVRGIDLEIERGELFGLLGPNGAGKTTTLSMLATLLAPSRGDASIFGASLRRDALVVRRSLG